MSDTLDLDLDPRVTDPVRTVPFDRSIDFRWVIGQRDRNLGNESTIPYRSDEAIVDVCSAVEIRHDQARKVFRAVLSRDERSERPGIRSVHMMLGGPQYVKPVLINTEGIGRFSAKRFEAFAEVSLAMAIASLDLPEVAAHFRLTDAHRALLTKAGS